MSHPNDYTVGWICAISTEYAAAQAFLDERHDGPDSLSEHDNNDYALGRMGKHNVVISVLPHGEYGISSAAGVARNMLHSFANIRVGLLVGIGGGAPSAKHDIRLGDVVVSAAGTNHSAVFQYEFGKAIQHQEFLETGVLSQPPPVLRAAVNGLITQYKLDGHQLEQSISSVFEQKPRLRQGFQRPDQSSDLLYRSEITHTASEAYEDANCAVVCGVCPSNLVQRRQRTKNDDNPAIHYGLIASANRLMKDALLRDKFSKEKGVLCFEMEAAGLMNHFPCLVIRGICDYSDTHKNQEWQGYAAMAAAAYAKDLLNRIAPSRIQAEKKISDILTGLQTAAEAHLDIAREHRDIAREQVQAQKDLAKEKLTENEQKCHQMFRLTVDSRDVTYEWYKERVENRVEDTCLWFLQHERYQTWLRQESGPLLVSADPGCGKSVLAKYMIDHGLPRSSTICYFFFKDQDQNTVRQALCALLHQLFYYKPFLINHAMTQLRNDGQGLINSTESLWKILRNAVKDPLAGSIVLVLDALDECAESDFADLMRNIGSQFRSKQLGDSKLRYFLTCRPYEQIISKLRSLLDVFPNIHIPGEEESEAISQEVNRVITYRLNQLSETKRLSPKIRTCLEERLKKHHHRTYLWVYLIFNYLEEEDFKKNPRAAEAVISILPRSVNEAYERILSKSKEDAMVRKVLSIILVADRPLTVSEMNVAVNVDASTRSIYDLDLEDDEDFKSRLRSWCGLFVSIYHGNVYFLHQTAHEFLLADLAAPMSVPSEPNWYHSITIRQAHAVIAEVCVLYLNLFNSAVALLGYMNKKEAERFADSHPFLHYSAESWGDHFYKADFKEEDGVVLSALRIYYSDSMSYSLGLGNYWNAIKLQTIERFTYLMLASYFDHRAIAKLLLENGADVEAKDCKHGRTALSWAAGEGHEDTVKLLLENGADVDAEDSKYGRTALTWAAARGQESIVKLLLENGADADTNAKYGQTPLWWAAVNGDEDVMRLLLKSGVTVTTANKGRGLTALLHTTRGDHKAGMPLILNNDTNIEQKDSLGRTPLLWAALDGHVTVLQILLERGAAVNTADEVYGRMPLSYAAQYGHGAVVEMLLGYNADIEAKDNEGCTPLLRAAENGHDAIVQLLLENDANIEATDDEGSTPLLCAAENNHKTTTELLLENGADIKAKDHQGRTMLWWEAQDRDQANT